MLRVCYTFIIAAYFAMLSGLAPNEAEAADSAKTCVFEAEKQLWLAETGHDSFAIARTAFQLFDQTLASLPWQSFASKPANPTHQDAADVFRAFIKGKIDTARIDYESILSRLTAIRKPACDVCFGVIKYKALAEPITKTDVLLLGGGKVSFKDLTLREINNEKIREEHLTKMYAAVVVINQLKVALIGLDPNSTAAIQIRGTILGQESIVRSEWPKFLEVRQSLGADPGPIVLEEAAYSADTTKKYDCKEKN